MAGVGCYTAYMCSPLRRSLEITDGTCLIDLLVLIGRLLFDFGLMDKPINQRVAMI